MSIPRSVFLSRLGSSIVLWAVALGIIFSGNEIGFFFLIASVALIGLWEFYLMLDHKNLPNFKVTAMICAAVLLVGSFYYFRTVGPAHSYDFEMAVILFFMLVVFSRQMFEKMRSVWPLETMAYTLFGLLYVMWLFNFITKIVYVTPRGTGGALTGHFYVLYLIVVTKFSDMGAYVTGSLIGRHKMAPQISPKKTWEGFCGALAFSTAGSLGMVTLMGPRLSFIRWPDAVVLGLLLGFAAVIGDLAESLVKRATETKDSGRLLPGIGGALDLIDSLLFTAPLLYFYLRLVLRVS
jgi:phosphatidate cytidylyltransferase